MTGRCASESDEQAETSEERASAIGCELRSADPGNDHDERYLASLSDEPAVSVVMMVLQVKDILSSDRA